jgi:hypothetical protein
MATIEKRKFLWLCHLANVKKRQKDQRAFYALVCLNRNKMEAISEFQEFFKTALRKNTPTSDAKIIRGGTIDHDFLHEVNGRNVPKIFTITKKFRIGNHEPPTDTVIFNCARQCAMRDAQLPIGGANSRLIFLICDSAELVNKAYEWLSHYKIAPNQPPGTPPAFEVVQNLSKFLDIRVRASRVFERQALQANDAARLMMVKFFDVINKGQIPYIVLLNLFETVRATGIEVGPGFGYKLWTFEFLHELNVPISAIYSIWGIKTNNFIKHMLEPETRESDEAGDQSQLIDIYTTILNSNDKILTTVNAGNFNSFYNNIEAEMVTLANSATGSCSRSEMSAEAEQVMNAGGAKSRVAKILSDLIRAYATLLSFPKAESTCLFVERSETKPALEHEEMLLRLVVEKNLFYRETRFLNYLVGSAATGPTVTVDASGRRREDVEDD